MQSIMIICHMLDYDYIESSHNYNRDYICLETSPERKQTHLHGFM